MFNKPMKGEMEHWTCGGCRQDISIGNLGHNCAAPAGSVHAQKRGGSQPVIPRGE